MNEQVRRLALRSAAKVALGAALVSGCGGSAQDDTATANEREQATGDTATTAGEDQGTSTARSVDGDAPPRPANETGPSASQPNPETGVVGSIAGVVDGSVTGVDAAAPSTSIDSGASLACLAHTEIGTWEAPIVPTTDAVACCDDYTTSKVAQLAADAGFSMNYAALSQDESFVNCCRTLINAGDAHLVPIGLGPGVCCQAETHGFDPSSEFQSTLWHHPYCTPWGPPVPPSLDYVSRGVA